MMKTNKDKNPLALYIHIPFCLKKCSYCDFLSFEDADDVNHSAYVDALVNEILQEGLVDVNKYYVDSIYIGGGTPSLLNNKLIEKIRNALYYKYPIAEDIEFTIEVNPNSADFQKLNSYKDMGINRLSIGAQSFDDIKLELLGRSHDSNAISQVFKEARKANFSNINIDLIMAIPGQTLEDFKKDLQSVLALEPEHISCYSLQIEEGTPIYQSVQSGEIIILDDEADREIYHYLVTKLKSATYEHYEISNFAKKGYASRHNLKYWSMNEYLAFGLGAHSFIAKERFSNTVDMAEYLSLDYNRQYYEVDLYSEKIFTGLRKMEGLALNDIIIKNGQKNKLAIKSLEALKKEGLVIIEGDRVKLTLKGIDLSNRVFIEFI